MSKSVPKVYYCIYGVYYYSGNHTSNKSFYIADLEKTPEVLREILIVPFQTPDGDCYQTDEDATKCTTYHIIDMGILGDVSVIKNKVYFEFDKSSFKNYSAPHFMIEKKEVWKWEMKTMHDKININEIINSFRPT